MLRRGAHSIDRASAGWRLLSVLGVVFCAVSAAVVQGTAGHGEVADRRSLVAAGLAAGQVDHPLVLPTPTAVPAASKVRKPAALSRAATPAPRRTPTASPAPTPTATPSVTPTATPPPPPDPLLAYRGLGAWVDFYDYGHPWSPDPASIVDRLAQHGVRTLFLQTGLWDESPDILYPDAVNTFLDHAHAHGIRVVGWYLPGFADIDHDLRASLAVFSYAGPGGQHFDGFAPDIEDRSALEQAAPGASAVEVLARFDAGVAEYSHRLRQSVSTSTALGAIVPDARNDERSPPYWAGFPWPAIAANYDVVLPMAYWSVVKGSTCPATDAASYIQDVVTKTNALMGTPKPFHPIGGVADCLRPQDVTTYVDAVKATGSIGGSLYDFLTIEANPDRDTFWSTLARLNG